MTQSTRATNNATSGQQQPLSAELVRKVAERVYQLWLRDLQISAERQKGTRTSKNWP